MQIINCGKGVHHREVKGLERLRTLPNQWYAFTNLDLATGPGRSREIDVIMIADDRIFVIDIKDWNGQVESEDGNWRHNGRDTGPSPVKKVGQNARDIGILLDAHLKKHAKRARVIVPRVHGLVVITGDASVAGVATTETESIFHIEPFLRAVSTPGNRISTFKPAHRDLVVTPLTSSEWKQRLSSFFNARTGQLKPGRRRYGNFVASSDHATFRGPSGIFMEYDAEDENAAKTVGMLRVWDFSKADPQFHTVEGRDEITGREQVVLAYLTDRGEKFDNAFLEAKAYDRDKGIGYWEVFDRRRRLKRLSEFVATERDHLSRDVRYELVRQVVSRVADLHTAGAAHLNLGTHSVWLEAPSTARLSHLMAARIPQVRSLGMNRYQFLSSMNVPEDVLGGGDDAKRKDVFLLGVIAHHLVFGKAPQAASPDDDIPEWSPSVDPGLEHAELHGWLETALSLVPSERFADADAALRAFNVATESRPTTWEVSQALEAFRGELRTQRQVFSAYPESRSVRESDRADVWQSDADAGSVLVKLWKRPAWGDQNREAPRILDFLARANELVRSPPAGCAKLIRACWLNDAFCIVQEFVEGRDLAVSLAEEPERWRAGRTGLAFARRLAELVVDLHARGIAHGDLKPHNVIVTGDEPCPVLVDLIDFAPSADGEIATTAYTPPVGGRMERDRFAVGKIAEAVLALADLDALTAKDIAAAIIECRTGDAANATLLPLIEALDQAISPPAQAARLSLRLAIKDAAVGEVLPDEGSFFIRWAWDRHSFFLRGAAEEIEVTVDAQGRPRWARRLSTNQGRIGRNSRQEFMSLPADLTVSGNLGTDFGGLAPLLELPEFAAALHGTPTVPDVHEVPPDAEDPGTEDAAASDETGDAAEDQLAEEIASEMVAAVSRTYIPLVDVPLVWRRLIDVEGDLTTEGNAVGASSYRRDVARHVVEFEFSSGTFDFNRADTVAVERLDRRGRWLRIGELDIARSKPDRIVIEAPSHFGKGQRELVSDDERMRFLSHFGTQSLRRRESAISRILARQSREPALVDYFDPRINTRPRPLAHAVDRSALGRYDLNKVQVEALVALVTVRPLGLVQGPPGTGKTRFIAALAHYALTHGLARNVLLASQSHEAVNNAAEAVVRLFSDAQAQPSILRVGNDTVVSDRLMPFHTGRVEQVFKDRFSAEETERLGIVGQALGLPNELVQAVALVETAIRPVLARMEELEDEDPAGAEAGDAPLRVHGLRETLVGLLARIGLHDSDFQTETGKPPTADAVIARLLDRSWKGERIAPDRAAKLGAVAALGRDFVASVSTAQRNFETFLAGTRQIVAGTCVGLGRPSLGLTTTPFDLVIVDEAARCTASELSVPMQAGRWIVLVGDQAQLEPLHKNPEVIERVSAETGVPKSEVTRSDFERALATPYGRLSGKTLSTQYRMLPPIGRMVSDTFYAGVLEHGRTKPEIDPAVLPPTLSRVASWMNTDDQGDHAFQRKEKSSSSLHNPVEADLIIAMLGRWHAHESFREWAITQKDHAQAIGVICMYAAQRDLIRRRLQTSALSEAFRRQVKIDTVDSYQGKENPIVVVSLVRNNADGPQHRGAATIREGFLARPNRINVAASRAMDRLVIVGAMGRWAPGGPMSRLAAAFAREVEAGEAEIHPSAGYISGERSRPVRPSGTAEAEHVR